MCQEKAVLHVQASGHAANPDEQGELSPEMLAAMHRQERADRRAYRCT